MNDITQDDEVLQRDEDQFLNPTYENPKNGLVKDSLITLEANKLRVHYFFTESIDIEEFLKDTEIEMRITDGPEWSNSNFLTQGTCKPFYYMNPDQTYRV